MAKRTEGEGQLLDVTVVISWVELTEEGEPYAVSKLLRIDYEYSVDEIVAKLCGMPGVVNCTMIGGNSDDEETKRTTSY